MDCGQSARRWAGDTSRPNLGGHTLSSPGVACHPNNEEDSLPANGGAEHSDHDDAAGTHTRVPKDR